MTDRVTKCRTYCKTCMSGDTCAPMMREEPCYGALADEFEWLHARGLELAKALSVCITAVNPPDKDGISMHEWNQRLKAATKQACAVFDGSVKDTGGADGSSA